MIYTVGHGNRPFKTLGGRRKLAGDRHIALNDPGFRAYADHDVGCLLP